MITANEAKGLMGFEKAMDFIYNKITTAANNGDSTCTYTTDYKAKADKIIKELKSNGYATRFIHTPNDKREHKIVIGWD